MPEDNRYNKNPDFAQCRFCGHPLKTWKDAHTPCPVCESIYLTDEQALEYRLRDLENKVDLLDATCMILASELKKAKRRR